MRQGQQHRRGRGRSNNHNSSNGSGGGSANQHPRKGQNPLSRSYESNGPDIKVRGTPAHVAEKYLQLARDAQASGDPVLAENYLQHAEHYNRIIFTYREQQGLPPAQVSENVNGQMRSRFDGPDTDDNDEASDDLGQTEQPVVPRFPQEQQRGADAPRGDDRPPRQHDSQQQNPQNNEQGQGQGRFRDRQDRQRHRNDRNDRFDNRGDRGDRPEQRSERYDNRPERIERGDRDRDRGERSERGGDRGGGERGGDRSFDRPQNYDRAQNDRPAERHPDEGSPEPRFEPRQPEVRPPVDVRPVEPRAEPRIPRERHVERALEEIPAPAAVVIDAVAATPPPARAEAAPRARRERFGPGNEQPDFLRRPVRRPRREAEPAASPAPPATSEEPSRD